MVGYAISTRGICFSSDFSWDDAVVVTVSDAGLSRTGTSRWNHARVQIAASVHHSTGTWRRIERGENAHPATKLESKENQKSLPKYFAD